MKNTALTGTGPLAIGTGLVALDVIIEKGDPSPPKVWAGGTCGNVLLALRYLGFNSAPVSRLKEDSAGRLLREQFRAWGVSTRYLSLSEDGSTPVIVQTIRKTSAGDAVHTFNWRCSICGGRFPGYKPVLVASAEKIASGMPKPQVFFFDRVNRGSLILAKRAARRGALVVFEPSGVGEVAQFREAWSISHVVKYSHKRLAEIPAGLGFGENLLLQIETLADEGLRYRARFGNTIVSPWRTLDALKAPSVKDTAGAGDWCTAGLLYRLGRHGAAGFRKASPEAVVNALRFGQALAAWNCGFVGARGGMESTKQEECLKQVTGILKGRDADPGSKAEADRSKDNSHFWCSTCSPHQVSTKTTARSPRRTIG